VKLEFVRLSVVTNGRMIDDMSGHCGAIRRPVISVVGFISRYNRYDSALRRSRATGGAA
jgi:hypothetical protein